jgi:hypothetical protein
LLWCGERTVADLPKKNDAIRRRGKILVKCMHIIIYELGRKPGLWHKIYQTGSACVTLRYKRHVYCRSRANIVIADGRGPTIPGHIVNRTEGVAGLPTDAHIDELHRTCVHPKQAADAFHRSAHKPVDLHSQMSSRAQRTGRGFSITNTSQRPTRSHRRLRDSGRRGKCLEFFIRMKFIPSIR